MKKIHLYLIALIVVALGCSSDSSDMSAENGGKDGTGGSLAIFVIKGNYLYAVDNSRLNVFSLLNEDQPVKVNTVEVGFAIETLFSNGDYLFIGSREGMYIFSVTNPENPQMLSSVQHFTACDPVVANDTHAFVTLHSTSTCGNNINALEVYDTADTSNPVLIHTRSLVQPKGLGLFHNYLVVCDDVIKIFDIQNPAEPVLAASIDKACFDVIIMGNELFAIADDGLYRYTLDQGNISYIVYGSSVSF